LMILVPTLGSGNPNPVTLDLLLSQQWTHSVPTLNFGNPNLTKLDSNMLMTKECEREREGNPNLSYYTRYYCTDNILFVIKFK
ncbi:MAG: hypothetical protein MJE68_32525, partial [Proteobacteria bacterium]|nr:hypothetical protein [Pseudomonadota bacterium]